MLFCAAFIWRIAAIQLSFFKGLDHFLVRPIRSTDGAAASGKKGEL